MFESRWYTELLMRRPRHRSMLYLPPGTFPDSANILDRSGSLHQHSPVHTPLGGEYTVATAARNQWRNFDSHITTLDAYANTSRIPSKVVQWLRSLDCIFRYAGAVAHYRKRRGGLRSDKILCESPIVDAAFPLRSQMQNSIKRCSVYCSRVKGARAFPLKRVSR